MTRGLCVAPVHGGNRAVGGETRGLSPIPLPCQLSLEMRLSSLIFMISWAKIPGPAVLAWLTFRQTSPSNQKKLQTRKREIRVKGQLPFNHIFSLKTTPRCARVTDVFWHWCLHTAGMTAGGLQDTLPFSLAPRVADRCVCNAAVAESFSQRQAWVQAAGFDQSDPSQLAKSFVNASTVRARQMANFTVSICHVFHYPLNFLI